MIKILGKSLGELFSWCRQTPVVFWSISSLAAQACLNLIWYSFVGQRVAERIGCGSHGSKGFVFSRSFLLLHVVLVSSLICPQELILNITDMRDAPVNAIDVGVPFKIKIAVRGFSIQGNELAIKGLDKAVVDAHQEQISIINGVRSCLHTYCVRIDQAGSYLIGPATAPYHGSTIESEPVNLSVTKAKSSSFGKKEAFFARLTCEKESIFLGEKVYCHIYFYAKNSDTGFTNLLAPSFNAKIDNTHYQGPFESVETIQGVQYICRHVQWLCCPKSVGEVVIPAYTIVYTLPSDDRAQFGGFSAFFGMRPTQHALYTNAVSLNVKPLPAYAGAGIVQAIGSYEKFELAVKQATVQVGQALLVTLKLTGSGDIEALTAPVLEGLPDTCKQYESQVTNTPVNDAISVKAFEYILQATVPDSFKIPEQKFIFFDTKTGRYKTLTTKAHTVTVTRPPAQLADFKPTTKQAPDEQKDPSSLLDPLDATGVSAATSGASAGFNESDADVPQLITRDWHSNHRLSIPWWLLWLLFMVPPLIALLCMIYFKLIVVRATRTGAKKFERAFVHARASLLEAEEKSAYKDLYPIFSRLFATRMSRSQQSITDQMIRKSLLQAGYSEQLCDEWQQFFSDCASFVFLDNAAYADPLIFKQAHYWLSLLEQAL